MSNSSTRRRWARVARYFAYCAAGIIVVVVAAALILPEFLDSPAVRAQIQRKISEVVQGEVAWEDLSVRILPSPRGVLRKARVVVPGTASVSAEAVEAHLLFWPLLQGRAEITSVNVVQPVIRIDVAPAPTAERKAGELPGKDPVEIYRSAVGPMVDAVRKFAPDTGLAIEDAAVDISASGMPPIQLSKLSLRAQTGSKGMEIDLTTASNYWSRLKLAARVEFADLSGRASLEAADIKPQAWLDRYLATSPVGVSIPAASLRAQARTDARTSLGGDFELRVGAMEVVRGAERVRVPGVEIKGTVTASAQETAIGLEDVRIGASRLNGGTLRYSPGTRAVSGSAAFDVDLAQDMEYTRRLVSEPAREVLAWFQPVTGRAQGRVKFASGHSGWSVGVDVQKSDSSVQIRDLPGPVRLASGAVEIDPTSVTVDRAAVSMPAGRVLVSALSYSFKDGATAGSAEFDFDLARWLELARRALPEENRDALSALQSVTGRAQGKARFAVGREDWSAGVDVLKSDSAVQIRDLPSPVRLAGGAVEINAKTVKIDRVSLSMLDAQALVSATLNDYRTDRVQVTAAMPEGTVGEKFLAWIWQLARVPPNLELKAPIRIAAQRIAWSPKRNLEVAATARFDAGPSVAVELGWMPDALHIRRAVIKDERSDATVAIRTTGRLLEGSFSGALHSTSIAAVLKDAQVPSGNASGDLRFNYDRDNPGRTTAEGHLKGEALDLAWLLRRPVKIDRIDLATDENTLRIREAAVDWASQKATIRGEIRRSARGPVIDAQLDSPGINLDALLPPRSKTAVDAQTGPAADGKDTALRLWPLPVTGRIAVRSDFVQSGRYKVAPVSATLVLEEQRAYMDLKQAELCGISLPLTIEATPGGLVASARIVAQKQQLEQTARCLTEQRVLITGDFDLKADITTHGRLEELARNLKGTVSTEARDGRVMKFALLGNILSMQNVAALFEKGGPRLDDAGFPYRTITVAGHFEDGRFVVEESAFRSSAVGLAANGWISLLDGKSQLTVLVAPFSRVDELVRKVPILGYVVGGTFTSVPVSVIGDIRDPVVVPLGPRAVTSELMGIFERTLKLPSKLITPEETK